MKATSYTRDSGRPPKHTTTAARCHVQRLECTSQNYDPNTQKVGCEIFMSPESPADFFATACYDPAIETGRDACTAKYCTPPSDYDDMCTVIDAPDQPFPVQACLSTGAESNQGQKSDRVRCLLMGRRCTPVPAGDTTICSPLNLINFPQNISICINPALQTGLEACESGVSLRFLRTDLTDVIPNSSDCPRASMALTTDKTYLLSPSPLANAAFLDQTVGVNQRGGFARVGRTCNAGSCQVTQLASMRILGGDFNVLGTAVKNPEIRTNRPATVIGGVIEEGDLVLDVAGTVGSRPAFFQFTNGSASVIVTATNTTFDLQGGLTLVTDGPGGGGMTVSVTIDSAGTAVAADPGCDTMTPTQLLFGFEDAAMWRSGQAELSTIATPRTQGCFATGVSGSGYLTIQGSRFPASATLRPSTLKGDLFIPTAQPNIHWLGALQSYLDCPSANVLNAYIGQVELTGRPTGQFSTLTFPLPQNVKRTLAGGSNDCSVKLALNVNQTGQMWALDNLRFLP